MHVCELIAPGLWREQQRSRCGISGRHDAVLGVVRDPPSRFNGPPPSRLRGRHVDEEAVRRSLAPGPHAQSVGPRDSGSAVGRPAYCRRCCPPRSAEPRCWLKDCTARVASCGPGLQHARWLPSVSGVLAEAADKTLEMYTTNGGRRRFARTWQFRVAVRRNCLGEE